MPPITRGQLWRNILREVVRVVAVRRRGVHVLEITEAATENGRQSILQIPLSSFVRDWQPAIYCEEREHFRSRFRQAAITVHPSRPVGAGEWLQTRFIDFALWEVDEAPRWPPNSRLVLPGED